MYGTYMPSQKFNSIKYWKNSLISKMSRTFIFHNNNNNAVKLLTVWIFFSRDSLSQTRIFRSYPQFFFENGIFTRVKKNWKNLYGFWKINELIWNKKGYSLSRNVFYSFVNNILALLLCKIDFVDIFYISGYFQIFVNITSN